MGKRCKRKADERQRKLAIIRDSLGIIASLLKSLCTVLYMSD